MSNADKILTRICPGMNIADLSLWISVAMTLHVFDIRAVEGEPARFKYTNGIRWISSLPFSSLP